MKPDEKGEKNEFKQKDRRNYVGCEDNPCSAMGS
jgi:hypothetical protein